MPMTEDLPSYDYSDRTASPRYTRFPDDSERALCTRSSSLSTSGSTIYGLKLVLRSDGIELDLGPRLCRLRHPIYGFNAIVEGRVRLDSTTAHIVQVTATLKGKINTFRTERGVVTESRSTRLLSKDIILFKQSNPQRSVPELDFSIPFPTYVQGRTEPLPPSSYIYHPGVSTEVRYKLVIDAFRKGIRQHKQLEVPVVYLPTTKLSTSLYDAPLRTMRVVDLTRKWCKQKEKARTNADLPSVSLFLPSLARHTAGDTVSVTLKFDAQSDPALTKLLTSNAVKIELIKRTRLWLSDDIVSARDRVISTAEFKSIQEDQEGVSILQYGLTMGQRGGDMSWYVKNAVIVEYLIRAQVQAPALTSGQLPNFICDEFIQLVRDDDLESMPSQCIEGLFEPETALARGESRARGWEATAFSSIIR